MNWFKRLFGFGLSSVPRLVHKHKFSHWVDITIPIGPPPYHTKEIVRVCTKCGGVEMMFGDNWKNCVPPEYKNRFIDELARQDYYLLVDKEEGK